MRWNLEIDPTYNAVYYPLNKVLVLYSLAKRKKKSQEMVLFRYVFFFSFSDWKKRFLMS